MTAFLFATFGLVLGSFSNVLIARLPEGKKIGGRSACPHCQTPLHPSELIPIASYVLLQGRCRSCRKSISMQYPLVEGVSTGLALSAYILAPSILSGTVLGLALWLLFTIAVTDWKTQGIPDALNLPFITLAFLYSFLVSIFDWRGVLIGTGFFGFQWLISRGKWIGSGDVLLALGASALLGSWQSNLAMLFFAYVIGAVVASILLISNKVSRKDAIAFGPFIAIGTVLVLLVGDTVFWM